MVTGEIPEEYVLFVASEIVVVDGDPNPWGAGRKIDQGGNVSSLNDRDEKTVLDRKLSEEGSNEREAVCQLKSKKENVHKNRNQKNRSGAFSFLEQAAPMGC